MKVFIIKPCLGRGPVPHKFSVKCWEQTDDYEKFLGEYVSDTETEGSFVVDGHSITCRLIIMEPISEHHVGTFKFQIHLSYDSIDIPVETRSFLVLYDSVAVSRDGNMIYHPGTPIRVLTDSQWTAIEHLANTSKDRLSTPIPEFKCKISYRDNLHIAGLCVPDEAGIYYGFRIHSVDEISESVVVLSRETGQMVSLIMDADSVDKIVNDEYYRTSVIDLIEEATDIFKHSREVPRYSAVLTATTHLKEKGDK